MPFFVPGRWEAAEADGKEITAEAVAVAHELYPPLDIDTRMPAASAVAALRGESERAHMVVVGARGRGGFHSLLLGSTSLQLAGHADSPVAVVRDGPNAAHHEIVVGVDDPEHSAAALDCAFAEAAARSVRLRALHAWSLPSAPAPDPQKAAEEERRALTRALAGWHERYPGVEVVDDLTRDHPAHSLILASERADLVIVGSRGRGGFHGLALGSVSHAVLHHALCPVVVARPRSRDRAAGADAA